MRIGIFGGTFSPVHNGHVSAARAFAEQMWLDVLFIIPTGLTPHKEMSDGATALDRLTMCSLAFEGMDGVIVSDLEVRRKGKSFTIDTLREIYHPDNRLFLLCGTDMMLTLDTWKDADEIFKLSYPVYIRREDDEALTELIIKKNSEYKQKYGKIVTRIVAPAEEISSSEIRGRIRVGASISDLVPTKVAQYIEDRGLYRDKSN